MTETITKGTPDVTDLILSNQEDKETFFENNRRIEFEVSIRLVKAIYTHCVKNVNGLLELEETGSKKVGMGIEGKDKEGNVYRIGNRKLMNSANIEISNIDLKKASEFEK